MTRRRLTWLVHNTLVAPMILVRLPLWLLAHLGELCEAALNRLPDMRRWNGW